MIISHKHRFIFLKTRKTAGTSVEIALSRQCGPDDVITSISPADEVTRRSVGGVGPQNHRLPLRMHTPRQGARLLLTGRRATAHNHMPAAQVRRLAGPEVWESYFKFSIERNPWDAVISFYFWRTRDGERPPLSEFLDTYPLTNLQSNAQIYSLGDTVAVDRVCRFESLAEDLEKVRAHLGLPEPLELTRAKAGFRPEKRHYREYYTPSDAARVSELFDRQIANFGYAF